MKPNCFIVGAPKTGTTSLATYLGEHPRAFLCDPKEPFYWAFDLVGMSNIYGVTTLDRYEALFANANPQIHQIAAEGSTSYLASERAIEGIVRYNPAAKFIAMIRNPVELVHALHGELVFNSHEDEPDFEIAWRLRDVRSDGKRIPPRCPCPAMLQYDRFGLFAPQLRRLFQHVAERNRMVIVFDDFKRDTAEVYRQVCQFLGLTDTGRTEFCTQNAPRAYRLKRLTALATSPPAPLMPIMNHARRFYRNITSRQTRASIRSIIQRPVVREPLSEEFEQELNEFFAPDIRQTAALIGRDLSEWEGS